MLVLSRANCGGGRPRTGELGPATPCGTPSSCSTRPQSVQQPLSSSPLSLSFSHCPESSCPLLLHHPFLSGVACSSLQSSHFRSPLPSAAYPPFSLSFLEREMLLNTRHPRVPRRRSKLHPFPSFSPTERNSTARRMRVDVGDIERVEGKHAAQTL